jgi:peroxiredoxin Q/BCP
MSGIREGSKAPRFKLNDKNGAAHGVGVTTADYTVLYFYPKDNTPGCTVEAQEFSNTLKEFERRRAKVIGISGGDQKTKEKFCSKYDLEVDLVSDSDFSVSRAYGVYGEKKFMGRTYQGIHRRTFVVDKSGKVVKIFDSVTPKGHAQEVLEALDQLKAGGKSAGPQEGAPRKNAPKSRPTRSAAKRA